MTRPGPFIARILLVMLAGTFAACSGGCGSSPDSGGKDASTAGPFAFWPAPPAEPRVQFVKAFSSSEDVSPSRASELEKIVFGEEAGARSVIAKPYGVAARDGKIYVADMRGAALAVLDLRQRQTRLVGITGSERLLHPVAVAVADDGQIYVADNTRNAIFEFDAQERFSRLLTFEGFRPVAVAVAGDRLYAVDLEAQNVVVFDRRRGERISTIGTVGDADGQFRVPIGLATDKAGNLFVVDMMRCRVQKFSPEGDLIGAMGVLGDYAGSFARPKHIAVDGEGIIYVVDATFQNVQMFDEQFRLLMHFGAAGTFPGAMNLPAGIAVCDEGVELFGDRLHPGFKARRLIVVSNQFGDERVVVYALGERRPEFSRESLASTSAELPTGVATPTDEQLRLQNPGGEEPPADGSGNADGPPR